MRKRRISVYDIKGARGVLEQCGVKVEDESHASRPAPRATATKPKAVGRVLIVEDDDAIRTLLERALASRGFDVVTARDGHEALAAVGAAAPDLAIVDVMMPGLDGFSFVLRLRKRASTADLPVVFMSARTDARSIKTGIGLGARQYVTKPFKMRTLIDKIERVMGAKAA